MADQGDCLLRGGDYLGEVSALCILHPPSQFSSGPYLLAGTGSQIFLYELVTGNMIKHFEVFEGVRVHGISLDKCHSELSSSTIAFKIAVFGEKKVKLFSLIIENLPNQLGVCEVDLIFIYSLPKLSHWVLDVCFVELDGVYSDGKCHFLAVGCSDNSIFFWDISKSTLDIEVRCSERCLLYSMRMWGDSIDTLRVASGTIFNEIIVWKVICCDLSISGCMRDHPTLVNGKNLQFQVPRFEAFDVCRLVGHEGSIFRIAWSSDGSKFVSASDDRCARIWYANSKKNSLDNTLEEGASYLSGPVLFGHSARVWDCFVHESFIITAGEDCTCRIWGMDGTLQGTIKEHIGRGLWRCLYDVETSLLVTAGFDSSIKLHQLHLALPNGISGCIEAVNEQPGKIEMFTCRLPTICEPVGHMDSKSEYVRCLRISGKDSLYVATNNGYLYNVKLSDNSNEIWTQLIQVTEEVPIVCMDLFTESSSTFFPKSGDWIAVGDGMGNMSIVKVSGDTFYPTVELTFSWSAEMERQLLGTYWCKSLGYRFVFTTDPSGNLKLWRLFDTTQPEASKLTFNVSLVAEYISCFGIRLMCLDASLHEEVIVCGDLRGNLVLFSLSKSLIFGTFEASELKAYPLSYFKGAHGISSICSVTIFGSGFNPVEVHSTGGDGCICYFEYEPIRHNLEFIGLKQVKEINLVQSTRPDLCSCDQFGSDSYAVGFASSDFIIRNLISDNKVTQVACGGWRRPYSFFLGDVPEMKHCFAFVKDETVHIYRCWIPDGVRRFYPQNLHLQFHGREMHTLCFISEGSPHRSKEKKNLSSTCSWIATGCEDGTVRLTRYGMDTGSWSASKLLGEHVGGSSVRSLCYVSKAHTIEIETTNVADGLRKQKVVSKDQEDHRLLISVGAKRVLTVWKQNIRKKTRRQESPCMMASQTMDGSAHLSGVVSDMSFRWLATEMSIKYKINHEKKQNTAREADAVEILSKLGFNKTFKSPSSKKVEPVSDPFPVDKLENDWRYLAVTSFLIKVADSRISVCFIVVACSDATLSLRALVLPFRLWYDVAVLVPLSSPALSLQHVIISQKLPEDSRKPQDEDLYIVVSGSSDGSIALWDLTDTVEAFIKRASTLDREDWTDCQRRPETGRGSQGGRRWRSLGRYTSRGKAVYGSVLAPHLEDANEQNHATPRPSPKAFCKENSSAVCSQAKHLASPGSEVKANDLSFQICKISPLYVLNNAHQSGVNCLHVSEVKLLDISNSGFRFCVISGGDDQTLSCHGLDLALLSFREQSENLTTDIHGSTTMDNVGKCVYQCRKKNYIIRFLSLDTIRSAHSSAIKGVWTDGRWLFSTGLDQRVRCWELDRSGKLIETAYLVVSVPEPEALDAQLFDRNCYQIAVAGRGIQMIEFFAPDDLTCNGSRSPL